jgi:putative membrane protein
MDALVLQHMDGWSGWWGWWPGIVMMVVSALVLAAVVLLVVRVVLGPAIERTEPPDRPDDGALAVLRERYARGDITEEEFRERRAVLREREN